MKLAIPLKILAAILLAATLALGADSTNDQNVLGPLRWKSTGVLASPIPDARHPLVSVKDPSVVFFNGRWHIYATTCDTRGAWSMVYFNFVSWPQAASAAQYYVDENPNLQGYHCAPEVFYFRPLKKWYLICVGQEPQYATTDDLFKPQTWTRPKDFFNGIPASVVDKAWLDYCVICDQTNAYLFFTGDNGRVYRSQTRIEDFPNGMSDPVIILQSPDRAALFEGTAVYHIKGKEKYLALIEAFDSHGSRFYKAFLADSLGGTWRPLADTWEKPFAGITNVTFDDGVKPWTKDISHGQLIREGHDETLTVDPDHLQFLYQGRDPASDGMPYSQLPYRLGLLRLDRGKN